MTDFTGKIVAVLQDGQPILALVTNHGNNKLQLVDARGRQHKSHSRYLLTAFTQSASIANVRDVIEPLYRQVAELRKDVDTAFLWECLADEPADYSLEELTETFFSDSQPIQQVALFTALQDDILHFKIKGQAIQVRDRQVVEEQKLARERQQEREAWERQAMAWLQTLLGADEAMGVPEEMEPLVQQIEDFLLRRQENEVAGWLDELDGETPPRELAYELLVLLDRIPDDADPLLVIAGIDPKFPPAVRQAAEALEPFTPGPERTDFTALAPFSIDDEDTREIDDALTVEDLGETIRVGIHIADVAHFVQKDSVLDREALRRCATVYIPSGAVTMFPERLAHGLASLNAGELRPCMTCLVTFTPEGEFVESTFTRGTIKVAHRLTYEEADAHADDLASELGEQLRTLIRIADAQRQARHTNGAITIVKPEVKVYLDEHDEHDIEIRLLDPLSPSRQLISELMILCNAQAGEFAIEHELPVIFRGQPPPSEKITAPETYDPVQTNQLFRLLRRSRTSTHPQRHSGLGLDAYTQSTSPIRRYTDLITQRQIAAQLVGEEAPYSDSELLSVLGVTGDAEQDNRAIERQAIRFYVMSYLDMHCRETPLSAIVLNNIPGGCLVELEDFLVRGRLNTNAPPPAGTRVEVVLINVDPHRGRMSMRTAQS